jgi:hypothetical protein
VIRTFAARTFASRTWLALREAASVDDYDVVHYDCLLYTQTVLQALSLPIPVATANIIVTKFPLLDEAIKQGLIPPLAGSHYPCVLICPWNQEIYRSGTNARDYVGYPVLVVLCNNGEKSLQANLKQYLGWRQMVHRALRNQIATIAPETVFNVTSQPLPIASVRDFDAELWTSATVFEFVNAEIRGPGT